MLAEIADLQEPSRQETVELLVAVAIVVQQVLARGYDSVDVGCEAGASVFLDYELPSSLSSDVQRRCMQDLGIVGDVTPPLEVNVLEIGPFGKALWRVASALEFRLGADGYFKMV